MKYPYIKVRMIVIDILIFISIHKIRIIIIYILYFNFFKKIEINNQITYTKLILLNKLLK